MEKEEKKRKGYTTTEAQVEANKRYLASNPMARDRRKISTLKSNGKKFILNHATVEELKDYENYIEERRKNLKEI